jgi:predicted nucleotidyltransferase
MSKSKGGSTIDDLLLPDMLQRLSGVIQTNPSVVAGWWYGSTQSGEYRSDSDVDIGILTSDQFDINQLLVVAEELDKALGTDRIDLKDLKSQPIAVQFAIVSGKLLFVNNEALMAERYSMIVRLYEDSQITLARSLAWLKQSKG